MSNDKQEATGKQFYETADKIITVEKQERSYSEEDTREKPLNQNKITAVEWLYNHLFPKQLDGFSYDEWDKIDKAFEKAKEMEKTMIKTILERYMGWDKVINNSKKIGNSKLLHRAEGAKGELGAILGQFGYSVNLDSSKAEEYLKNL